MSIQQSIEQLFPQFEEALKTEIVKHATLKKFTQGEVIMRSGEALKYTLLVTEGRIKIYTDGEEGEDYFMYFLEPGQACAMSFICAARNKKSELEAIASEDGEAIMIPIDIMDSFMVKYRSWYYFVLESYRSRFQELLDALRSVAFHSMDERIEYYLVKQKNVYGTDVLHLTHEQIATDLNTSRVVVSRLLKQMESAGKLKLHRNSIELKSSAS